VRSSHSIGDPLTHESPQISLTRLHVLSENNSKTVKNERPTIAKPTIIYDVTGDEGKYTLDGNGFQFLTRGTRLHGADFHDAEVVKTRYYPEAEALLKDVYVLVLVFVLPPSFVRLSTLYFYPKLTRPPLRMERLIAQAHPASTPSTTRRAWALRTGTGWARGTALPGDPFSAPTSTSHTPGPRSSCADISPLKRSMSCLLRACGGRSLM